MGKNGKMFYWSICCISEYCSLCEWCFLELRKVVGFGIVVKCKIIFLCLFVFLFEVEIIFSGIYFKVLESCGNG